VADGCPTCHDAESWCAACGGTSSSAAMTSTAGCRGAYWAEGVVARMRIAPGDWPPWPAFDESPRVRAIALRKVADLGGDERTRIRLARYCCESAGERYEELRAEVAAREQVTGRFA
jgi:hypothetical protein